MDRTLIPSPPPRPKNPVFDDEEKSKVKYILDLGFFQMTGGGSRVNVCVRWWLLF